MTIPISVRWIITLVVVTIVVALSVVPAQAKVGDSVFVWLAASTPKLLQKTMHLLVYASMTCLLAWSLEGVTRIWLRLAIAFLLAVSIGVALEWFQTRVPGRFGTLFDIILNAIGAIIGLIAALLVF